MLVTTQKQLSQELRYPDADYEMMTTLLSKIFVLRVLVLCN